MNDMENIKKILSEFEVPYDHNDWIRLEKDLPKSPGMSGMTKTILVATAVILSVTGVYLLSLNLDDNKSKSQITEKTTTITPADRSENSDVKEINGGINLGNNNKQTINSSETEEIVSDSEPISSEDKNVNAQNSVNNSASTEDNTKNTSSTNDNSSTTNASPIPDLSNSIFKVEIIETCVPSKIIFSAANIPDNCEIVWNTDENFRVYGKNAEYSYLEAGKYNPEVNVIYNNFILKTVKLNEISINQPSLIKINFDNSENSYYFTCNNKDDLRLLWSIDNQQFSEKEVSYDFNQAGEYLVKLTAINEYGCKSETIEKVNIVVEHVFYVPTAFIPNSNGVNSSFGPIGENMEFESYKLLIVDGTGNTVFESDSPEFMWNGRINNIGDEAKPGFYLWEIKTLDKYGNLQTKKGRVNLIRN